MSLIAAHSHSPCVLTVVILVPLNRRRAVGVRYALLVVLDYSRLLRCRSYPLQDIATLFDGLEERFCTLGGAAVIARLRFAGNGQMAVMRRMKTTGAMKAVHVDQSAFLRRSVNQ